MIEHIILSAIFVALVFIASNLRFTRKVGGLLFFTFGPFGGSFYRRSVK
jgi:hypothetical protein